MLCHPALGETMGLHGKRLHHRGAVGICPPGLVAITHSCTRWSVKRRTWPLSHETVWGLLTLSEKESYLWKLNGVLRAESTWITTQGIPLLHCTPRHWSTTKASLVIAPEALTLPDLPLLVVLDWYIRLMMFAFAGTVML